jgi:hypothetical protein
LARQKKKGGKKKLKKNIEMPQNFFSILPFIFLLRFISLKELGQ